MKLNPETYIPSLLVRINNLYNRDKWKRESYKQMIAFLDELDLIREDVGNGKDVQKSMLTLNRKLITKEGSGWTRKYPRRSAQRQAMRMR